MSPEDDLQTISETINNGWNTKAHKINGNGNGATLDAKKPNGTNTTNGYKNGAPVGGSVSGGANENGLHANGDGPTWLPLLAKDSHDLDSNGHHTSNNNKWSSSHAPSLVNSKYGWEELPQDDNDHNQHHHLAKPHLNGIHLNGKGTNGIHHNNGYADKNEQESLTGIVRQPELDELSSCGVGLCQPKWARYFASTHVFMVIFLFAWVLQVRSLNFHFVILLELFSVICFS